MTAGGAVMAGLMALPLFALAVSVGQPRTTPASTDTGGDTRLAWAEAFANRVGAASPEAVEFALAWATEEGANAEANNPLDSTLAEPGSTLLPGNPDGVRMYPDLATGLMADVTTLTAANAALGYLPIVDALRRADLPAAAAALQQSRWCVDPRGPLGHQCPGYGDAILQIVDSYADPTVFAEAGQVRAGTTALPSGPVGAQSGPAALTVPPGAATVAGPAVEASAGSDTETLLAWLGRQLGKPYVWGGSGPAGYDCSGLAMMAYAQVGVPLPRTAAEQYAATARVAVPLADAQPGDLLFWAYRPADPATIHHVAIYVGPGRIVEAAHEGVPVHEVPVWNDGGLMPVVTRPAALRTAGTA